MECLDDNDVSEFVTGSLGQAQASRVEAHLASCRDCRDLVAALAADAAADSGIQTVRHEKLSASQVTYLPKRTLTIGDKVGRYLILSTLGTGGMGIVFAAYDPQLDRKVALKLLRTGLQLPTKDAQRRLRREAQAIAQLSHPNVVAVYDVGMTDDDDLYIAMEFVEGETLSAWLKAYPRSWREILDVYRQAGQGLVAAHGSGMLHRDFKPDNVLVGGDGRVRVTDFGLARSLIALDEESGRGHTPQMPTGVSSSLTATGTVLGTPRYMPPEQLMGPDIDARADQFSFCVALYEALYSAHPLPGATSVSMLEKGDRAIPPPAGTKIPASVGAVVLRGLEKDRVKRYPAMSALLGELVPRPPRQPLRWVVAGATAVLVVGLTTAAALRTDDRPRISEEQNNANTAALVDELNRLRDQIRVLNHQRQVLLRELEKGQIDLDEVKTQLAEKDDQIQKLVSRVVELDKPRLPPPRTTPQGLEVIRAAQDVDVDNCFTEWLQRTDDAGRPHREARLSVTLTIEETGQVKAATATGADSPSLRFCVQAAFERAPYPRGADIIDVLVSVEWGNEMVNRTARVIGRREPERLPI